MGANAKILVVDDDPDIVASLRMVLEGAGYEVYDAGSADGAMEQAQAVEPDLIILDIMMPEGTEGFHFVWSLRNEQEPPVSETSIMVLSSIHEKTDLRFYPDESDGTYEPGEFLPVQDFIDKPVEPGALLSKVEELLEESG